MRCFHPWSLSVLCGASLPLFSVIAGEPWEQYIAEDRLFHPESLTHCMEHSTKAPLDLGDWKIKLFCLKPPKYRGLAITVENNL